MEKIEPVWAALRRVKTLEFVARSQSGTGWSGTGTGTVSVEVPAPESIVFRESGIWRSPGGGDLAFRNVYRWLRSEETVRLEHLRFGENHPVFLFDLASETDAVWSSVAPHLCRDDRYAARLELLPDSVSLQWNIRGPEKDEEILYRYR
jgi:hypothetical protein